MQLRDSVSSPIIVLYDLKCIDINYFWAQCIIDNTATATATATATTNVRDLLMPLIKPLFSTDDNGGDNSRYGRLLASIFYWDQDDDYLTASSTADWSRVSVAESSSSSVDVDWAVREARRHYEQITEQLQLRREEFLPSPPDQPDDDDDGECNY
jgi:hypothetical protein